MRNDKLYFQYENLITAIAKEVAESFHCIRRDDNGITTYSQQILEDLKSEGTVEFFRLLNKNKYDESKGELSTYLYPHIKGVMRRYLETNLGVMSVSKNSMDLLRKVQHAYNALDKSVQQISDEFDISEKAVVRCINYNTHFYSIYDAFPDESSLCDTMITGKHQSPEKVVNRKICIELLKEMFNSLSEKDKAILGHTFGVFGYEKKTLDEIALEEMIKIDGVEKAKSAAFNLPAQPAALAAGTGTQGKLIRTELNLSEVHAFFPAFSVSIFERIIFSL